MRGYEEAGTTTTAFDVVVHDVINRVSKNRVIGPHTRHTWSAAS